MQAQYLLPADVPQLLFASPVHESSQESQGVEQSHASRTTSVWRRLYLLSARDDGQPAALTEAEPASKPFLLASARQASQLVGTVIQATSPPSCKMQMPEGSKSTSLWLSIARKSNKRSRKAVCLSKARLQQIFSSSCYCFSSFFFFCLLQKSYEDCARSTRQTFHEQPVASVRNCSTEFLSAVNSKPRQCEQVASLNLSTLHWALNPAKQTTKPGR